jgi:hypothetical protein
MPFLFVFLYDQHLHVLPPALQEPFSQDAVTLWQNWKLFNAHFEAFSTNFNVELGVEDVALEDLFYSAIGTEPTWRIRVTLQQISVVKLLHQFPSAQQVIDANTECKCNLNLATIYL